MITHVWREGGVQKSKVVTLKSPGPYTVVTGGEPVDESIEIAVPSDLPTDGN